MFAGPRTPYPRRASGARHVTYPVPDTPLLIPRTRSHVLKLRYGENNEKIQARRASE